MGHRSHALRYHGRGGPRSRWRRFLLVVGVAAALGALAFLATAAAELVSESQLLVVRGVKVSGASYLAPEAIVAQLGDVAGKSLLAVHPAELGARLTAHPRIRAARVSRRLDRRLLVEVEEREPIALLDAGVLVEVDREGMVLPPVERAALPDLPVLTGGGRLPAPGSEVTTAAVREALRLLVDLAGTDPEFLAAISTIDLRQSPVWRFHLVGRSQVLKADARAVTAGKLAGLRMVLEDLDQRGRTGVEVDLRFEGQIVVRELK